MIRISNRKKAGETKFRLFLPVALAICAGCATAAAPGTAPSPAEIPQLEARVAEDSSDVLAMVRLGAAYRAAGQTDQARETLERALRADPNASGAVLYLGLTYEDLERYTDAQSLYERYLTVGQSAEVKAQLRQRLPLLQRRQLQVAIRNAVQTEAGRPIQPRTVAVLPFLYTGQDEELQPLSRAMADMLATDLEQSGRLTILERTQIQLLLDELQLGEQGLVDPATAARSGRLLGAERVVQGSLGGNPDQITMEAAIRRVAAAAGDTAAAQNPVVSVSEQDALAQLMDAEARLALKIYDAMGIQLTPAERERVANRPTENVQALLAYGRGLQALDRGNFEEAAQQFEQAVALDPSFQAAQQRAASSGELAAAARVSTGELAQGGAAEAGGTAGESIPADLMDAMIPDPSGRDPSAEILGTEGLAPRTILEIIIRRPSGEL